MSSCYCISQQQLRNICVFYHLGGQLKKLRTLAIREEKQQPRWNDWDGMPSFSVCENRRLPTLNSYDLSVKKPMMKMRPMMIPINPPTYEKQLSTLLKLREQVVVVGSFVKIRSIQEKLPAEFMQQQVSNRLGTVVMFYDYVY